MNYLAFRRCARRPAARSAALLRRRRRLRGDGERSRTSRRGLDRLLERRGRPSRLPDVRGARAARLPSLPAGGAGAHRPRLATGHILHDGTIEPHQATERRLLSLSAMDDDLFVTGQDAQLAAAYRRRARAVAHRAKPGFSGGEYRSGDLTMSALIRFLPGSARSPESVRLLRRLPATGTRAASTSTRRRPARSIPSRCRRSPIPTPEPSRPRNCSRAN